MTARFTTGHLRALARTQAGTYDAETAAELIRALASEARRLAHYERGWAALGRICRPTSAPAAPYTRKGARP